MKIRNAKSNDIVILKALARRVVSHNYKAFLGDNVVNMFIESGQSDKEIDDNIQNCFVAEQGSILVGFVIIKNALLHLIMIDVGYQNKGCGTDLLNFAEQIMFKKYTTIALQTFEKNPIAIQFYIKNGWVVKESHAEDGTTMLSMGKTN